VKLPAFDATYRKYGSRPRALVVRESQRWRSGACTASAKKGAPTTTSTPSTTRTMGGSASLSVTKAGSAGRPTTSAAASTTTWSERRARVTRPRVSHAAIA